MCGCSTARRLDLMYLYVIRRLVAMITSRTHSKCRGGGVGGLKKRKGGAGGKEEIEPYTIKRPKAVVSKCGGGEDLELIPRPGMHVFSSRCFTLTPPPTISPSRTRSSGSAGAGTCPRPSASSAGACLSIYIYELAMHGWCLYTHTYYVSRPLILIRTRLVRFWECGVRWRRIKEWDGRKGVRAFVRL